MIKARVVNTDHFNTTLTTLEDLPSITWTYKRSDMGSASWVVPLSHPNLEGVTSDSGDPLTVGPDVRGFGPKLTDFRIGVSDTGSYGTWNTVFGGICGPVGLDSDMSAVSVSGTNWLAWLEQPYRFPGYAQDWTTTTPTQADILKLWANTTDASVIIANLVANLWNGNQDESVHITTTFTGTDWSTYPFPQWKMIGENATVLSMIKSLGGWVEPNGFEFYMGYDKILHIYSPRYRKGYPKSYVEAVSLVTFSPSNNNIIKLNWTNTGPKAITTIGMPAAFPAIKGYSTYAPSVAVYRNWWQLRSIGSTEDFKDQHETDKLTESWGKQDRFPQKALTITFQPETLTPDNPSYYFYDKTGEIVRVQSENWFQPYLSIDAYFWIDTQTLACDDAGNWTCTCELEQIYF